MKLVTFEKSAIAVMVFMASLSGAKAANTDTAFINTSTNTNIVIAIKGQDEGDKVYDLDQIQSNTDRITSVDADLNSTKDAVIIVNAKADSNTSDISDLKRDSSLQNAEITSNNQQIGILATNATQDKADQQAVNHALTDVNLHQDTLINANTSRIKVLENQPKPKDGVNGKDGAKGDKGDRGLTGATTTITKVDTATQAKVASNSVAIAETAKQSANVAKDLQDAKQFLNQQQSSSNAQFKSLKDEMDDNKKESRSGAASAIAIASMPQVEAGQSVMFSAGAGTFKDEQALSVGASFHAGTSTVIKAGVSDSTNNDFAMGAGIGIGF